MIDFSAALICIMGVIILIEDKSLKDMSQATQKGIRFAKTAKRFIKYLKFLFPYIAPLLLIFLILFLIIMVIFWAAPKGNYTPLPPIPKKMPGC